MQPGAAFFPVCSGAHISIWRLDATGKKTTKWRGKQSYAGFPTGRLEADAFQLAMFYTSDLQQSKGASRSGNAQHGPPQSPPQFLNTPPAVPPPYIIGRPAAAAAADTC